MIRDLLENELTMTTGRRDVTAGMVLSTAPMTPSNVVTMLDKVAFRSSAPVRLAVWAATGWLKQRMAATAADARTNFMAVEQHKRACWLSCERSTLLYATNSLMEIMEIIQVHEQHMVLLGAKSLS